MEYKSGQMLSGVSSCDSCQVHVRNYQNLGENVLINSRWNHHLLSTVATRPDWLTIKNGAKTYIDAVMRGFPPNHIFLNTAVDHVTNDDDGKVVLHLEDGRADVYDHVIIATHGDQAKALILPEADQEEREILSGFETSRNTAILHSDLSLMPKNPAAWSSWNYITKSSPTSSNIDQVCLTYNMNILQHIPVEIFGHVLVYVFWSSKIFRTQLISG